MKRKTAKDELMALATAQGWTVTTLVEPCTVYHGGRYDLRKDGRAIRLGFGLNGTVSDTVLVRWSDGRWGEFTSAKRDAVRRELICAEG